MKKFILLFIFALSLSACSSSKSMLEANETALFELQKTACMGTCPVFTMRLAKDGRATLKAEKFMEKQGFFTATFPKEEVKNLIEKFEVANFSQFKDSYTSNMSDLPTTYITFEGKKIMDYDDAPDELKKLEKALEALIDRSEWQRADQKAKEN